jgi:hypothetical protein
MSTRRRFENLKTLLDAIDTASLMGIELPPLFFDLVKNVQEEFKDELSGDAINIVWSIGDIHSYNDETSNVNDDYKKLTDDEARGILLQIERNHDAEIGINWDVIDVYLDEKD